MLVTEIMKNADLVCDIKMRSFENVKDFNQLCCATDGNFDVISGRYVVDGKSILGLFSLALDKPLTLAANFKDEKSQAVFEARIKEFKA